MSGLGAAMAGGNPGALAGLPRERVILHPTPPEVTAALLAWWRMPRDVRIWEPAAGRGDMVRELEHQGYDVLASDLHDHGAGFPTWDFLDRAAQPAGIGAVVTNPPFEHAAAFIERWFAMRTNCRYLAVLLKAQFWHVAANLRLRKHMTPLAVLPITWRVDFLGLGGGTMDVSWTVFDREMPPDARTIEEPLPRPWPKVRQRRARPPQPIAA